MPEIQKLRQAAQHDIDDGQDVTYLESAKLVALLDGWELAIEALEILLPPQTVYIGKQCKKYTATYSISANDPITKALAAHTKFNEETT